MTLGDSKLKIVMTDEDMREYKLDTASDYSSPGYRRAFWQVLERAKRDVGFDTGGDKVLIQFYPLKNGGCEVFVTKLGILSAESARLVTKSERVTMLSRDVNFYAFESLSDMKNFHRAVVPRLTEPYPRADVYITDGDICYLSIDEYAKGGEPCEFPEILEFSRRLTADLEFFITEHLTRVTEGDALTKIPLL